jgi:hypothetical protein
MSDLQLFQATLGLGGYKEKIQEHPLVRTNDHPTARRAADQVKPRRINQTLRLLIAYRSHTDLTAEEASIAAKLEKSCYWKRVGELLASGYITETGHARKASPQAQINGCAKSRHRASVCWRHLTCDQVWQICAIRAHS